MGATRLFAIGLFMFVGSCGGAATEVAYPDESCKAAGCGRVTTIGVIGDQHRLADGTISTDSFFFVDLEAKDEKGSPYAYAVSCSACPFEVGKRYRARLNPEGTQLHSILWDGGEIRQTFAEPARPDGLYMTTYDQWRCNEGPSHWEMVDHVPTCKPGAAPAREWTDGEAVEVPGCSRGHPKGLGSINFDLNFQISILIRVSAYVFEDSVGVQEEFPAVFIAAMNSRGFPQPTAKFVAADGPPNLFFEVDFTEDHTGDHYGLTIVVKGPKDRASFVSGGEAVEWFTVVVPPVYKSDKLFNAAATAVYERLWFGWSCKAGGGATPEQTLEAYCKANPTYTCNYE